MTMGGSKQPADVTVRMTRDSVGLITSIDEAVGELLGWRPEQLIGSPSTRFIHPADQSSGVAAWLEMITSPGVPRVWRGRYQTAAGAWMWVETVNCLEEGEHPVTIAGADMYGLPVSTTHVLSSGVAGTMAANGSGLQLSTIRNIALAWVLTLPMAMMLSAGLYVLFLQMF